MNFMIVGLKLVPATPFISKRDIDRHHGQCKIFGTKNYLKIGSNRSAGFIIVENITHFKGCPTAQHQHPVKGSEEPNYYRNGGHKHENLCFYFTDEVLGS